jgi:hypothetical protein
MIKAGDTRCINPVERARYLFIPAPAEQDQALWLEDPVGSTWNQVGMAVPPAPVLNLSTRAVPPCCARDAAGPAACRVFVDANVRAQFRQTR